MSCLSWRQQSAKRRDTRATHGEPQAGKHRSNKDTKRWCKGVPGREHKVKCVKSGFAYADPNWRELACSECGKVLKRYWPMNWGNAPKEPKPDWVDC